MKKIGLPAVLNAAAVAVLVFQLTNSFLRLPFWDPFIMEFGFVAAIAAAGGGALLDLKLLAASAANDQKKLTGTAVNKPRPLIRVLRQYQDKKMLKKNLAVAIEQIERYDKKRKVLLSLLQQDNSLNGDKCHTILANVTDVFYGNVRSLIAQASIFDQREYKLYQKGRLKLESKSAKEEKGEIFKTLSNHADAFINRNEDIILQMDKLALELTKAVSTNEWDTETILTMQKLDSYLAKKKQEQDLEREAGEAVIKQLKKEQQGGLFIG